MSSSPATVAATWCDVVTRDAFAFLDGALAPDAHAAIGAHVARCARCRARVAGARRFLGALRRSGRSTTAPEALRARAHALLADWRAPVSTGAGV